MCVGGPVAEPYEGPEGFQWFPKVAEGWSATSPRCRQTIPSRIKWLAACLNILLHFPFISNLRFSCTSFHLRLFIPCFPFFLTFQSLYFYFQVSYFSDMNQNHAELWIFDRIFDITICSSVNILGKLFGWGFSSVKRCAQAVSNWFYSFGGSEAKLTSVVLVRNWVLVLTSFIDEVRRSLHYWPISYFTFPPSCRSFTQLWRKSVGTFFNVPIKLELLAGLDFHFPTKWDFFLNLWEEDNLLLPENRALIQDVEEVKDRIRLYSLCKISGVCVSEGRYCINLLLGVNFFHTSG